MYTSTRQTRDSDFSSVLQLLLNAGADPDLANKEGETPLMMAARLKRFGVAETLLARSKNPTQLNAHGENLIHLAFQDRYNRNSYQLGADEVMRSFVHKAVARGVDPQQPIGAGETLKILAERNGAIDFARFLASLSPT
jgi:ankyrin repeat protein